MMLNIYQKQILNCSLSQATLTMSSANIPNSQHSREGRRQQFRPEEDDEEDSCQMMTQQQKPQNDADRELRELRAKNQEMEERLHRIVSEKVEREQVQERINRSEALTTWPTQPEGHLFPQAPLTKVGYGGKMEAENKGALRGSSCVKCQMTQMECMNTPCPYADIRQVSTVTSVGSHQPQAPSGPSGPSRWNAPRKSAQQTGGGGGGYEQQHQQPQQQQQHYQTRQPVHSVAYDPAVHAHPARGF